MIRRLLFFTLFGIIISGCTKEYGIVKKTSDELGYQDTLVYSFDTTPSSIDHVALTIIHADDFPYQNVYFTIGLQFGNQEVKFSSHSIQLSSKEGIWLGRCKSGECLVTSQIQIPSEQSEIGSLQISLIQNSREPSLQGIRSIGLALK